MTVTLPPGEQTEINALLKTAEVSTFSLQAEGVVYVFFHGHEPEAGNEFRVRYEQQQSATCGSGSLLAPFTGEHGWFWMDLSEQN